MTVETFVRAMPKVELNVRLEGMLRRETLMLIAEQNEIRAGLKHFDKLVDSFDNPDFLNLDKLIQTVLQWLLYPEDITRIVYDLGVSLAKENVKYAEVNITPAFHMASGISFEDLLIALNDGRDRVERGWGIRLSWILAVPRNEPRRSDETFRWASGVAGRKSNVVGFGLLGDEDLQPVGQFERSFQSAQKKGVPTVVQCGNVYGAEGIHNAITHLSPSRVIDGLGIEDDESLIQLFAEQRLPIVTNIARLLCHKKVDNYADYPFRQLYDENIPLIIGADMPTFYKANLSDEYLALVEHGNISVEELEEIALNAIRFSFMLDEEKQHMIEEFKQAYADLRAKHLTTEIE